MVCLPLVMAKAVALYVGVEAPVGPVIAVPVVPVHPLKLPLPKPILVQEGCTVMVRRLMLMSN